MPTVTELETFIVGPPADPELRAIGEHVLAEVQAAAVKALAHSRDPKAFPVGPEATLEQIFIRRFKQKPAARLKVAVSRARATATEGVDLSSPAPVEIQLRSLRPQINLSQESLQRVLEEPSHAPASERFGLEEEPGDEEERLKPFLTPEVLKAVQRKGSPGIVLKPVKPKPKPTLHLDAYTGVQLRLGKLRCVEETDGPGSDEIALGGIVVAANGATHKIDPFMVSNDFDSGEAVKFGPRTFFRFNYKSDAVVKIPHKGSVAIGWPRTFHVTFLLAEIDNGGFPAFVNDIFNAVKNKVAAEVGAAIGAVVGGIVGSEIPVLGTAIGAAIGAVCGWLLGELWEALQDWWEDDEFVPITVATKRKTMLNRFEHETSFDCKNKVVWWKGHGGYYKLAFDWQVVGGPSPAQ